MSILPDIQINGSHSSAKRRGATDIGEPFYVASLNLPSRSRTPAEIRECSSHLLPARNFSGSITRKLKLLNCRSFLKRLHLCQIREKTSYNCCLASFFHLKAIKDRAADGLNFRLNLGKVNGIIRSMVSYAGSSIRYMSVKLSSLGMVCVAIFSVDFALAQSQRTSIPVAALLATANVSRFGGAKAPVIPPPSQPTPELQASAAQAAGATKTCHAGSKIALAAMLVSLIVALSNPAFATVIEFDETGGATIYSGAGVGEETTAAGLSTFSQSLAPDRREPRDQSVALSRAEAQALAANVALAYSGAEGVRAAGMSALEFQRLFEALVYWESRFDNTAISPKGAIGLGQLMPATAELLGVDPRDPRQNLDGAARYLVEQLDRFGHPRLALAAYNAGPERVVEYGGVPPFRETRRYIAEIAARSGLDLNESGLSATQNAPNGSSPKEQGTSVWEF